MNKDNFYYILRDRLEYAEDYLIDTSAFIKSVKFQDKVEKEFFKDKILLYLLVGLINIPSDLLFNFESEFLITLFDSKSARVTGDLSSLSEI